jgi:N-methylhydantoinase B
LIREIDVLADAQVALLADRRKFRPYGLQGGEEGAAGHASIVDARSETETELPGKCSRRVSAGSILRIETPGGGGWGEV